MDSYKDCGFKVKLIPYLFNIKKAYLSLLEPEL